MKLKELQETIINYIITEEYDSKKFNFIQETKNIPAQDRLKAYQESYSFAVNDLLESNFKVTGLFLGVNFTQYCAEFLKLNPSKTRFINELGRSFPQYVSDHIPKQAKEFVVPLVRLEWLMNECFFDFYQWKSKLEQHNELPEADIPIVCNPSLKFIESEWPLHKIWLEEKEYPKDPSLIAIWASKDRNIRARSWTAEEFMVLKALQQSHSLNQCIEKLAGKISTEALSNIFSTQLSEWVELELLTTGHQKPNKI